jgi:type VI secretion system protein ImpG
MEAQKRDELLHYYERELRFIRGELTRQFAAKYPKVAMRLLLEPTKCEDPHVERFIEAVAMLSARVHQRLDDEFPEITDALLEVLYPHYLTPVPSMTIVQFQLDPKQSPPASGVTVERRSVLYSRPVRGVRCRFRTSYPATLWPLEVHSVELAAAETLKTKLPVNARAALKIRLQTKGGLPVSKLDFDSMRFFVDADSSILIKLYELFFVEAVGVLARKGPRTEPAFLGAESLRAVGFEEDQGLLEYPPESFLGYRLLQEYFTFEEKFAFVDFTGLRPVATRGAEDFIELVVLLDRYKPELEGKLDAKMFKLGCTPAVNLFTKTADPISLDHFSLEYPVLPDRTRPESYEVYRVAEVSTLTPEPGKRRTYRPLYALHHGHDVERPGDEEQVWWRCVRRESHRKDVPGTDLYLSLVNEKLQPTSPSVTRLEVEVLCTNRDLPSQLPPGGAGDFEIEKRPEIESVSCLRKPTTSVRPALGHAVRWRLISHLTLNHLSLIPESGGSGRLHENAKALDALKGILELYDFAGSPVTQGKIAGVAGLRTAYALRRIREGDPLALARGLEVEVELDETRFAGSSALLFTAVLERFFGLYTSVNSFVQTSLRTQQREGIIKQWPPRAGDVQFT